MVLNPSCILNPPGKTVFNVHVLEPSIEIVIKFIRIEWGIFLKTTQGNLKCAASAEHHCSVSLGHKRKNCAVIVSHMSQINYPEAISYQAKQSYISRGSRLPSCLSNFFP